jgi:predicted phosphoribosyltransferase
VVPAVPVGTSDAIDDLHAVAAEVVVVEMPRSSSATTRFWRTPP